MIAISRALSEKNLPVNAGLSKRLDAAIGIELMKYGCAVSKSLFPRVCLNTESTLFVWRLKLSRQDYS
jgi:hypothetical protein